MEEHRNQFEPKGLLKQGNYNLQVGAPNPNTLKKVSKYLHDATERMKTTSRFEETFQYGVMGGAESVKDQVAQFLTRQYAQPVIKDNLFITCGASQGLLTILNTYLSSNHTLFLEDPTYLLVPRFIKQGYVCKGESISMQADGMDLNELEAKVKKLPDLPINETFPFRAAVYAITIFHNPTGICYTAEKCRKLVKLARKYNLLLIADDVYNVLSYELERDDVFKPAPQRLFAYDDPSDSDYKGNVITNGSFAKITAPGLRLGWWEAPKHILEKLMGSYAIQSGGGMSSQSSYILAEAMRHGDIDKHVQELRVIHKKRMDTIIDIVEKQLGEHGVTISHPAGGYFLWVKLPEHIPASFVLKHASERYNVTFVPGKMTSLSDQFDNYIRLSFAYYELEDIKEGTQRFADAVAAVIKANKKEAN